MDITEPMRVFWAKELDRTIYIMVVRFIIQRFRFTGFKSEKIFYFRALFKSN